MSNPEKMTQKTLATIQNTLELARSRNHGEVEPIHILRESSKEGVLPALLSVLDIDLTDFQRTVDVELEKRPRLSSKPQDVRMSPEMASALNSAEKYMGQFGDEYLSIEHILLGIRATDRGAAKKVLDRYNMTEDRILAALQKIRGSHRVTDQNPESQYEALEKYGIDFTKMAVEGRLDPVIGREMEMRRVMKILSRRRKNNPALVGEPGVGKTAIVEKLAQKIADGDVPEQLKDARLIQLDMASLIAGTQYRGEFEKRLKSFVNEITASEQKIILFIDEMHTIVGAGATGGSMDASNILKPALARGELHTVGATTFDEYRKYIEKDPALERRFATIMVDEPSVDDTISILRGLREKYELHHGVRIADEAIQAAAKLSARYISDRFLPDKAIDLIDEAAANLCIDLYSQPEEIDRLEKGIAQLKIEKKGLEREDDMTEQIKQIDHKISDLTDKVAELKAHWQREKAVVERIKDFREQIDFQKRLQQDAEKQGDLETAARIKYGSLVELRAEIDKNEEELARIQESGKLLKEEVEDEDIADVLSQWTGIPVSRITESEKQKLLMLEDRLKERVIGQDHVVESVANTVRIARANLSDPNRPLGSFIFLGSTGVGKTELAKTLAEVLFDSEEELIRIDMSEYMEKHSVSRLIGAPPGYVGYEEGGQLTEQVRRHPFSVVLFDEIEKAHPEVFNIFLQLLDDGVLTDNKGRKVSFKNTILIMTSNIGSRRIIESIESGNTGRLPDTLVDELQGLLKRHFTPEFLNRIDDVLVFNSLTKDVVERIVRVQFGRIKKRLNEQNIGISISDSAVSLIADRGYDPLFGARPIKRVVQSDLNKMLADAILRGSIKQGDFVKIDALDGELVVA